MAKRLLRGIGTFRFSPDHHYACPEFHKCLRG
jgi:hypothetical protein